MLNVYLVVLFGLAGAASGFMISETAEKIAIYKYNRKGVKLSEDWRFSSTPLRVALAVTNAGAWAFSGYHIANPSVAFLASLLITLAIIIAIIDLRIRMIPNELVLTMMVMGLCFQLINFGIKGVISSVLCMAAVMLLFTLVAAFVGLGKVGAGDIKLVSAMALVLGYPDIITALMIMSLLMILYCVIGIITRVLKRSSMFPFAPFIMLGMVSSLIRIICFSSSSIKFIF